MSDQYQLKIAPEQAKEMPMVDLAFELLKAVNTPFYYRDLMMEIAKIKGFSDDDVMRVIAQLYTEINVDGRFACVGNNLWGLKRWYPVENKSEEGGVGNAKRPRIINDDDDDLDEEDVFVEEEEDTYAAEEDEFDVFNEDNDEIGIENEEEEDMFGEEIDEEVEEAELGEGEEGGEESEEEGEEFDDDEDGDDEEDDDGKGR